jgi:hypothetical protein
MLEQRDISTWNELRIRPLFYEDRPPATTGHRHPRRGREERSLRLLAWSRARDGSAPEL